MKIALYEYTSPGLRGIKTILNDDDALHYDNKIRISEYLEVEFMMRASSELVPEQIAVIDDQIAQVNAASGKALAELRARKQELLALSYEPIA